MARSIDTLKDFKNKVITRDGETVYVDDSGRDINGDTPIARDVPTVEPVYNPPTTTVASTGPTPVVTPALTAQFDPAIIAAEKAAKAADAAEVARKAKFNEDLPLRIKTIKTRIATKAGAKVADAYSRVFEENPFLTNLPADEREQQASDLLTLDKRYNQPYLERFAGNQTLTAAGKNPLSMESYFEYEDTLKDYGKAYGMTELSNQDTLNRIIGTGLQMDVAAGVVNDVYSKVLQDTETLASFKKYYPMLTTGDIVSSVLLGTKNQADVNILNKKITAAQIGGAAAAQGLNVGMGDATQQAAQAEQYAMSGLTGDTAATAYRTIATELPGLQALGNTFGRQTGDAKGVKPGQNVYTQAMAEDVNIKGLASANRTRKNLIQYGTDVFGGDTGIDARSLAGPTGQY